MIDTPDPSSSTPLVAVRRVMNTLLAQRTKEFENLQSVAKPPRGKRLQNKTGLNITDDESVLTHMKENEEKKRRKQKTKATAQDNDPCSSTTTTAVPKRRGRSAKNNTTQSQPVHSNDPEIQAGISSLSSVIRMANRILNDDDSDDALD